MNPPFLITVQSFIDRFLMHGFKEPCLWCSLPAKTNRFVCSLCEKALPLASHYCIGCGHLFSDARLLNDHRCEQCRLDLDPKEQFFIHAFSYEPPVDHFLQALKFNGKLLYVPFLSHALLQKILSVYQEKPLPDFILPVPLHPKRLKERGFNQALEIAKPIAKILGIPLKTRWLTRSKHTKAQSGLSKKERVKNVEHAFSIDVSLEHAHLAVIDDVMTTGATFRAALKALHEAKPRRVDFWSVARTHKTN